MWLPLQGVVVWLLVLAFGNLFEFVRLPWNSSHVSRIMIAHLSCTFLRASNLESVQMLVNCKRWVVMEVIEWWTCFVVKTLLELTIPEHVSLIFPLSATWKGSRLLLADLQCKQPNVLPLSYFRTTDLRKAALILWANLWPNKNELVSLFLNTAAENVLIAYVCYLNLCLSWKQGNSKVGYV